MIGLRDFDSDDAHLIFTWRNDPYIVHLGSSKKEVTWDEHIKWFNNILTDHNKRAYVLQIDEQPAGQLRFDNHDEESCFISIYLIKEYSGKGYGVQLMKLGCKKIFEEWVNLKKIFAFVLCENKIGQKAFLKAGFKIEDNTHKNGHFAFVLNKDGS